MKTIKNTKLWLLALFFIILGTVLGVTTASIPYNNEIDSIRAELSSIREQINRSRAEEPIPTSGSPDTHILAEEIKKQIREENGLLPIRLIRESRDSFVELYAHDDLGKTDYGTAGYLGNRYFITVKHVVISMPDNTPRKKINLTWGNRRISATVVDAGNAKDPVHSGDWAILRANKPVDLPALTIKPGFDYDFAEPIFRLGNDYSKGIVVSTGYIGQRMGNGLVSCLTDGHPGVSGGGVLDRNGNLVGIPIGRMQGDYRFSFILPLRKEMFRKVPFLANNL